MTAASARHETKGETIKVGFGNDGPSDGGPGGWGVRVRDLVVSWGEKSDFRLEVPALDIGFSDRMTVLPLMGRTGFGKTTLLHALCGLKGPERGRIEWNFPDGSLIGWDPSTPPQSDSLGVLRRRHVALGFQDSILVPYLTVAENLTLALRSAGWDRTERDRRIREMMAMCVVEGENAGDLLGRYQGQLSGGQRRRAALAQVMVGNPHVLAADEPTANLDDTTRRDILKVVGRWLDEERGKRAFIWISHHVDDPEIAGAPKVLNLSGAGVALRAASAGF